VELSKKSNNSAVYIDEMSKLSKRNEMTEFYIKSHSFKLGDWA